MSKISTAEEFFKSSIPKYQSVSDFMTDGDIFYHAKEFAKLHVQAALKEASENAKIDYIYVSQDEFGDDIYKEQIDKNSILKAYSLSNIK